MSLLHISDRNVYMKYHCSNTPNKLITPKRASRILYMYRTKAIQRILYIQSVSCSDLVQVREREGDERIRSLLSWPEVRNLHFLNDTLSISCPGPFLTQRVAKANNAGVLKRLKQHPRAGLPKAERVKKAGTTKQDTSFLTHCNMKKGLFDGSLMVS